MKLIHKTKNVYYSNEEFRISNDELVEQLIEIAKKNYENLVRCCLHENEDSLLMSMIIVIRNKYIYPAHKHDWKDETYTIIKGICKYEEYDKKGKIISQILLKEGDHLLNKNKNFHLLRPLTSEFAFIENTIGPFKKQSLEYLNV